MKNKGAGGLVGLMSGDALTRREEEMVAATLSPGESTAEMALGIAGLVTALLVIASPM
jgi:hypothetical protein